jgi:hypothetical protein
MRLEIVDLRPSRLDLNALLIGTSLAAATRQAVVDAFERRGLLFGGEARSATERDAHGRLSSRELDQALAGFEASTRTEVTSVLLQVGASA